MIKLKVVCAFLKQMNEPYKIPIQANGIANLKCVGIPMEVDGCFLWSEN